MYNIELASDTAAPNIINYYVYNIGLATNTVHTHYCIEPYRL